VCIFLTTLVVLGIKYEDLAYTSLNGFATVGTNNGKNGTGGVPFYNKPETVIDFAWRSYGVAPFDGAIRYNINMIQSSHERRGGERADQSILRQATHKILLHWVLIRWAPGYR
jgi:hypothetical protein